MIIGVPHRNNTQGLTDLCASIDHHATLLIVDNTDEPGGVRKWLDARALTSAFEHIEIINPPQPLSVAQSWNEMAAWVVGMEMQYEPFLVTNDDIVFEPGTLNRVQSDHAKIAKYSVLTSNAGWSSFLWNLPECLPTVGLFDTAFYPAYFEDCDYSYRLKLAGRPHFDRGYPVIHAGSQTIKNHPQDQMEELHHKHFRRSRAYYTLKWGGGPGEERYTRPFQDYAGDQ